MGQKNDGTSSYYPCFDLTNNSYHNCGTVASFDSVQMLYKLERLYLVKYSYKLSAKAVNPFTLERQNVKLSLRVFNEYACQGLTSLKSDLHHAASTASFVQTVLR